MLGMVLGTVQGREVRAVNGTVAANVTVLVRGESPAPLSPLTEKTGEGPTAPLPKRDTGMEPVVRGRSGPLLRSPLTLGHGLEEDQLGAGVLRHLLELGLAEVVRVDFQVPALDGKDDVPGLANALPNLDSLTNIDLHGSHIN